MIKMALKKEYINVILDIRKKSRITSFFVAVVIEYFKIKEASFLNNVGLHDWFK